MSPFTGLSYFPFLDKFLCLFSDFRLTTMDDCNDNCNVVSSALYDDVAKSYSHTIYDDVAKSYSHTI